MINFTFKDYLFTYAEKCTCKESWSNHWCSNQEGCPNPTCSDEYRWCEVQQQDGCDGSEVDDGIRWVKCDDSFNPISVLTYRKFIKHGCNAKNEHLTEVYDGKCKQRAAGEWMKASADRCDSSDVKLAGTIYSDAKCSQIKHEKSILSYFPGQANKCYDLENASTIWTCTGGSSPAITRYKFVPILHLLIVLISTIMCVFF